ncbi:alpha-beta hydrolase superfamily lysophospholipase [Actinomadura pelletieri DSM 43383]|uniref:Alpha-beta hydrolase superfamily lysophospholipase n=1 Tax=Actinomadura pelletieri DSM 43383 TaxID=1120940 RepID=A0A495QLP5_9ACTN|nr:alpha/beta hydrolase [Actinomadura pelletieri]RKS73351.1 alpha-beta hydrolase superfamily lysophospholipase [Actinomadura pelletieri DSM 43383]
MTTVRVWEFAGTRSAVTARFWSAAEPWYVAVLVHGYGEHLGRYGHVVDVLVRHGAAVCGPDHMGHGRSGGERVLIEDYDDVVADVHTVVEAARGEHPGLPVVMIGHSMGGLVATRYAQRHDGALAALVLSGPVLGRWHVVDELLPLDEIPDTPIDTSLLSRDPAVGKAYTEDPLVWHGPFKKTTVRALDTALERVNEHGSLGDLPTFYMHGAADELVRPRDTRVGLDAVGGSDLTERLYPGARHEIFNEADQEEVLADVTAFVEGVLT